MGLPVSFFIFYTLRCMLTLVTEALEYQVDPTEMLAQPDMPGPKQAELWNELQTEG